MKLELNREKILKIIPWLIGLFIFLADQISKTIIVNTLKIGQRILVLGDFLIIEHVRNTSLSFNMLENLPDPYRKILIIILQSGMIILLAAAYFRLKDLTKFQKGCLAVAIGAGMGNLWDRFFLHQGVEGVVDWVSVKTYGILGFPRWPTFNIADSSLIIMIIILALSLFLQKPPQEKQKAEDETEIKAGTEEESGKD